MPFWVVLMARLCLGEELSPMGWISIGIAGVGLVAMLDFTHPGAAVFSKLIAVACGATWALGAIVVKRMQDRVRLDLLNFSFWQMLLGLIPMLALLWVTDQPPVRWSMPYVTSLLFLGIAGTALGWWMWFYVLKTLPAGTTGMSSLGVPVVALFGAMIHLGERPSKLEWVGMALILCALLLLSFDALKRNTEPLKVPE